MPQKQYDAKAIASMIDRLSDDADLLSSEDGAAIITALTRHHFQAIMGMLNVLSMPRVASAIDNHLHQDATRAALIVHADVVAVTLIQGLAKDPDLATLLPVFREGIMTAITDLLDHERTLRQFCVKVLNLYVPGWQKLTDDEYRAMFNSQLKETTK
jgi:hypothetical protein